MLNISDGMRELNEVFEDVTEDSVAEKVARLEYQVGEVERVLREIASTLSHAVDVRHDSYSYLEEVGTMEEETRAVVEAVIANIQSEIHADINDLLCPGSRIDD